MYVSCCHEPACTCLHKENDTGNILATTCKVTNNFPNNHNFREIYSFAIINCIYTANSDARRILTTLFAHFLYILRIFLHAEREKMINFATDKGGG